MVHPKDQRDIVARDHLSKTAMRVGVVPLLSLIAVLAGCSGEESIRHYQVPNKELVFERNHVASAAGAQNSASARVIDQRMLGAIIPVGDQTWYFKMVGPDAAVSAVRDKFDGLIKTVRFADEKAAPEWTLPDGWQQQAGSGPRFATMVVESDGTPLELTVSTLPLPDNAEVMLANVNRWRNQLGLNPISVDQIGSETSMVELEGVTATMVDLVGKAPAKGGGMGNSTQVPAQPTTRTPSPKYDTPEGWNVAQNDGYSVCALELQEDGKQLRVTVTPLGGMAGGIEMNLNRWRNQVGLPSWSPDELKKNAEAMTVQGISGLYIEAEGPAENPTNAVYGWLGNESGRMWFVKLRGDAELARRQRDAFRAFLKSFNFYDNPGATNGN